eukprot:4609574-Prymnesium_polylepis.1
MSKVPRRTPIAAYAAKIEVCARQIAALRSKPVCSSSASPSALHERSTLTSEWSGSRAKIAIAAKLNTSALKLPWRFHWEYRTLKTMNPAKHVAAFLQREVQRAGEDDEERARVEPEDFRCPAGLPEQILVLAAREPIHGPARAAQAAKRTQLGKIIPWPQGALSRTEKGVEQK